MLAYLEVLRQLKEAHASGVKSNLGELKMQAEELSRILYLFREGVMLLDEVDLILHPLKSELNFPIGEKFDLDGSEDGERWSLAIHLVDAIFFASVGQVSSFEQRGESLVLLERIATALRQGIEQRHLQRLPHGTIFHNYYVFTWIINVMALVTLLNPDYYNEVLKPLMAEVNILQM